MGTGKSRRPLGFGALQHQFWRTRTSTVQPKLLEGRFTQSRALVMTLFILRRAQAYTGRFFSRGGGLSHLCPKTFSTAPEKICYANLQNYFTRLIPPSNYQPGFRAFYLARQNEFHFFRLINTKKYFFPFLAVDCCPKNLADARKITSLPESGGATASSPLSRTPMKARQKLSALLLLLLLQFICLIHALKS